VVADKGYHSGAVLTKIHEQEVRSYIPEPERGRRKWQGCQCRHKIPAELPVLPIRAAVCLGGDAVGTL